LKSKKAFMFIITTLIIISLISLLIINIRTIPDNSKLAQNLNENYITEFLILNENPNLNIQNMDNFNNSFVNFIKSHNYNTKMCNIVQNKDNSMIISNYLDKDCNLFIDNDFNRTISNNSTIKIDNFINKMPIYLCNCTYINKDIYYIETYNYNNQIINKNMR